MKYIASLPNCLCQTTHGWEFDMHGRSEDDVHYFWYTCGRCWRIGCLVCHKECCAFVAELKTPRKPFRKHRRVWRNILSYIERCLLPHFKNQARSRLAIQEQIEIQFCRAQGFPADRSLRQWPLSEPVRDRILGLLARLYITDRYIYPISCELDSRPIYVAPGMVVYTVYVDRNVAMWCHKPQFPAKR